MALQFKTRTSTDMPFEHGHDCQRICSRTFLKRVQTWQCAAIFYVLIKNSEALNKQLFWFYWSMCYPFAWAVIVILDCCFSDDEGQSSRTQLWIVQSSRKPRGNAIHLFWQPWQQEQQQPNSIMNSIHSRCSGSKFSFPPFQQKGGLPLPRVAFEPHYACVLLQLHHRAANRVANKRTLAEYRYLYGREWFLLDCRYAEGGSSYSCVTVQRCKRRASGR